MYFIIPAGQVRHWKFSVHRENDICISQNQYQTTDDSIMYRAVLMDWWSVAVVNKSRTFQNELFYNNCSSPWYENLYSTWMFTKVWYSYLSLMFHDYFNNIIMSLFWCHMQGSQEAWGKKKGIIRNVFCKIFYTNSYEYSLVTTHSFVFSLILAPFLSSNSHTCFLLGYGDAAAQCCEQ